MFKCVSKLIKWKGYHLNVYYYYYFKYLMTYNTLSLNSFKKENDLIKKNIQWTYFGLQIFVYLGMTFRTAPLALTFKNLHLYFIFMYFIIIIIFKDRYMSCKNSFLDFEASHCIFLSEIANYD